MRLTNKTNLPLPLVRIAEGLVNNHPVFRNDCFSVTELLKSEQQIVLSRRHADEIEMDVQDTFSMWNGTAIHSLLEDCADRDRYITEMRLEEDFDGVRISGGFDLMDKATWTLYDYKTCKVAGYQSAASGTEDKWVRQLYAYADLIEKHFGRRPKQGVIIAMMTDHSKIKAQTVSGYPSNPIEIISWTLEDPELQAEYKAEREEKARRLKGILNGGTSPSPCTYGDMWCKEDYALMKEGAKRASKCFDSESDAREYLEANPGYRLYHRVSDFVNCKNYCQCRDFCPQWKAMQKHESLCEDITDNEFIPF